MGNRMRRTAVILSLTVAGLLVGTAMRGAAWAADPPPVNRLPVVKVYKSPTCGCCKRWVEHMRANGFAVEVTDMADVDPIKRQNHVPAALASCHTALVGGYVVEGHVPASDVRRLLREHPEILGLAAPGMPQGSPGMDVPGSPPYDVLALQKDGKVTVFASHTP